MIIESGEDRKVKKGTGGSTKPPPDGGWGWLVVVASFLIHVIADGVAYTFGLFFVKISEDLHETKSATSWIASIMAGMTYGVGPMAGAFTNKFGCRAVSIAGSFVAATGFAMSYFAQSVYFLYFSIGIVGGLGLGLIYLPAIVCVTCYFEKKRSFATGIAVCGSGFGTFLLAPLIEWLIRNYGWRLSLVMTGGIILLCFFFSLFFRPLDFEEDEEEGETEQSKDSSRNTIPTIVEPGTEEQDEDEEGEVQMKKPLMNGNGAISSPLKSKVLDNLLMHDTMPLSCSHPALPLVANSSESLPRLTTKRHSLKSLAIGPRPNSPNGASASTPPIGLILQRKDIFYSGSLMKLPTDSNGHIHQVVSRNSSSLERNIKIRDPSILEEDEENEGKDEGSEFTKVIQAMMDFSLLRDPVYLFFACSNFLTSIGYQIPYIYLVDKAIGDAANPKNDIQAAGFLLSIVGMSNTLSRVLLGYLSDKPCVNRLYLYNSALTICGLAIGLCSHTDNIHLLQLFSVTFGSTVGVYVSLTSVILVDLLGLERLTNAFGLLLLCQGVATVIGAPIVGELFDQFGDYKYGFWLAGGMIAISGLMLFLIPWIKRNTSSPYYDDDTDETEGTNHEEHIVIHCPSRKDKEMRKGSNNNVRY